MLTIETQLGLRRSVGVGGFFSAETFARCAESFNNDLKLTGLGVCKWLLLKLMSLDVFSLVSSVTF